RRGELRAAEEQAARARSAREEAQAQLGVVAARREAAEEALARRSEVREALYARAQRARSSGERIELRLERTRETAQSLAERAERRGRELEVLRAQVAEDQPDEAGLERIEALEAELTQLEADHQAELERELAALDQQ